MSDFEFINEPEPQQPPAAQPPYPQPPTAPQYPQPPYPQPPYSASQYPQQPPYPQPQYPASQYPQQPPYPQPSYSQPMYPQPQYAQPPTGQPQYPQPPYSQPYAPQYQPPFGQPPYPGQPPFATTPVPPYTGVPPEQPKGRGRARVAGIAAILLVVLIGAAFAGVILLRHGSGLGPTQAQAILDQAANAGLHDTTFTIAMNESIKSSSIANGSNLTINAGGHGAIIVKPLAMDLVLSNISTSGLSSGATSASEEIIIIGTTMYINLSGLGTTYSAGKPWIKISLADLPGASASGLGNGIGSTNFLDYHALHNPVLIGSEQVNGHATWHLRATMSATDNGLSPSAQATVTATYKQLGITQSDITEDMWIVQGSSFPAKIGIHESITTKPASNGSTTLPLMQLGIDETYTFTKWNTGVSITPPPANQVTDESSFLSPTPATKH